MTRLSRDQLQKFAQYLISQSPQQLPNAQLLLDDLLLNPNSEINMVQGAPDPTAGAPANEQTKWCLDEMQLHENIRKIVIKLCVPSPIVYSDVNYLSSAAPPAATEWSSLLRPLRGREPEGLWNLLSIVREMLRRHDRNALPLLQILTEEILSCEQILLWWFSANVSLNRGYPSNSNSNTSNGGSSNNRSMHSNIYASQHACCSLCDEIVVLWRLVALNPAHSYIDTQKLYKQLKKYHLKTLALIFTCKSSSTFLNNFRPSTSTTGASTTTTLVNNSNSLPERNDFEIFSGFKPAMISCLIDWDSYPIPGITHQLKHRFYEPSLNLINHAISTTSFPLEKYIWDTSKLIESKNTNYNEYFNNYTIGSGDVQGQASGKKSNNKSSVSKNSEESSYIQNNENNEFEDLENRSDSELSSDDENLRKNNENRQVQSSRNLENQHDEVSDDDYAIYVFEDWIDIKSVNSRFRATSSAYSNPDYDLWEKIAKNSTKVQPIEDPFEILFSRAEALYAHGYVQEACRLSIRLTEELLNNPPELHFDLSNSQNEQGLSSSSNMQPQQSNSYSTSAWNSRGQMKRINRNRFNPALHQVSLLTSATLSKAAFLCQVLSENKDSHLLAFYVGLFGLELVRPPASTKALEVKLAYQEQELVTLLKRIPLCADALHVLRERAEQLRDGRFTTRGEALLPLSLASYIFEALLFSDQVPLANRLPTDEKLVFDAAVAAIGLKAKVSEAEHPLLCEGTRRQRGDLALNLLVFYKDNKERLDLIMDKLLDQEIHPIFSSKKSAMHLANSSIPTTSITTKVLDSSSDAINQNGSDYSKPLANMSKVSSSSQKVSDESSKSLEPQNVEESTENNENMEKFQNKSLKQSTDANINSENKKPNSFESSAPDTTSSDNSPTVSRRAIYHKSGKTNSGSSSSGGESSSSSSSSSDSLSAFSDKISNEQNETSNGSENPNAIVDNDEIISEKCELQQHQQNIYNQKIYLKSNMSEKFSLLCKSAPKCPNQIAFPTPSSLLFSNSISNSIGHSAFKLSRYKGKRHYPVIPNQPSEALAHFMFELAKTLLAKAGGNNTSALFTQPTSSQNCRAPHRLLHMCAFQIGLYALGLHNAVSPNWLSRTYSSHVSWITCQAMEIGHPAIEFLIDKWEGHLTPSEVASLADRASRNQDSLIIKAAAELALSCLSHAHALTPSEIQRALIQCKEESNAKLERACLAVEKAAQSGGVYPEVLFHVAREWYRLYRIESKYSQPQSNSTSTFSDSMATQPSENGNFELNSPEASLHFKVDYFDKTNSMENNEAGYLGQIESNFYPHMLTPQPSLNSYQDFNQYLFISLNSCFNNSYSPRPYNSKMNINQQQMTPLVSSYYPRPSVIFDTPPCFYPPATNPNASSSIYPSIGYSPNPSSNATFRAPQHHYYTPWMMNQAKGNSSLFPPPSTDVNCFSSKQQPMGPGVNPPPIGNSPFSIISSTPQPFVRTPLGFSPGGLVAPKNAPKSNQALLMGMDNGHSTVPNSSALQHFHNYYNIPNNDTSNLLPTRNLTAKQLGYMHSAYRVGMLAMETLSRRAYDDRQQTRYAKNPSYGEDVKWLLFIAKKLGKSNLVIIMKISKFFSFRSTMHSRILFMCFNCSNFAICIIPYYC